MVPAEGFEPPTYGLQNRCTTTVLSRRGAGAHYSEGERNDLHCLIALAFISAQPAQPAPKAQHPIDPPRPERVWRGLKTVRSHA
jgi:hypothetical protein